MITVFVGESPSNDAKTAFQGDTPHGAGRRVARLLGVTPEEMHRRWVFRNLYDSPVEKWDQGDAYYAALKLCHGLRNELGGGPINFVYFGRKVAKAMNFDRPFFKTERFFGGESRHVVVPHPSGRCRAWNDPASVRKFRKTMSDLGVLNEGDSHYHR